MTKKQILEGNKLIAVFMDCKFISDGNIVRRTTKVWDFPNSDSSLFCKVEDLKFHYSWDWIILVLQKIGITLRSNGYLCTKRSIYFLDWDLTDMKIEDVWQTCVDFIEYYNKNNNYYA
jgi:hypothetical protein